VEDAVVAPDDARLGSAPAVRAPALAIAGMSATYTTVAAKFLQHQDTDSLDGADVSTSVASCLIHVMPGWLKYSLHARRTERFAVLITAVYAAAFFQCLLFVASPGCFHEPTPVLCQESKSVFDVQRIFEALWGIVFSAPCAYALSRCFHRPTTHETLTRIEKYTRMRKWALTVRGGWSFFLVLHIFMTLFFLRFVTFFSHAVLSKWIQASTLAALTESFSSTIGRTLMYLQVHTVNILARRV